jgi:fermentation-respiration switch protein FrsA (DUF1100 family)
MVAAGLVLVFLALRALEHQLIYFPPRFPAGFPPPQSYEGEIEDVWLQASDGVRINAFYRPHPASKQAILLLHGNAENVGYGLPQMRLLAKVGVNILAVDYRGYGKSEGTPSEAGVYRDADAAYDFLVKDRHFRPDDVVIYGHSLGGAVAVNLAARRPCGGLIVQSSFTNARAMTREIFALPVIEFVVKSRFDSLDMIRNVRVPVLIVHGTKDDVVPFAMGQKLFSAAHEPKRFYRMEGAGHNDLVQAGGEGFVACLKQFFTECVPEQPVRVEASVNQQS